MTAMLQRLADLRRKRADRAFEILALRNEAVRAAERVAREAARAVDEHVEAARVRERVLLAGLAGRTVRPATIMEVEAELDAAALETARRREAVARAAAETEARRSERAKSLREFQTRQRARERIDLANEEQMAQQARRETDSDGAADAQGSGATS